MFRHMASAAETVFIRSFMRQLLLGYCFDSSDGVPLLSCLLSV